MEKVLISIIIPCYNCEKWIGRCLDSILNQTYNNIEIICVNDKSSDSTLDLLSKYADNYSCIKIVNNRINLGPANSRNIAIKQALGEYLCFCDSDDWYERDYLEKLLLSIEAESSDISACEYTKYIESSGEKIDVHYWPQEVLSHDEIIVHSKSSLWLLMIKKSIFENMTIPDLRNGEDIAIIPCLQIKAKKISVVRECLYNYNIRKDSASSSVNKTVHKSLQEAFEYIECNFGDSSHDVLELLGIRTVLYGTILAALKSNCDKAYYNSVITEFERKYPRWYGNKYLGSFSILKRFFLYANKRRCFILAKLISKVHIILSTQ